jgi:hypothetical protein
MDNRVKILAFIGVFLLIVLSSPLYCIDFGVSIDNASGFTQIEEVENTQRDKVSLWFDGDLSDMFALSAQASYTFALDRPFFLTLDQLKFSGEFPSKGDYPFVFRFDSGRFSFQEFTGKVLAHKADGVYVEMGLPFMIASASVGYTGLFQTPASSIIISKSDLDDRDFDDPPFFGPLATPRLIETVSVKFPELFLRQTLNLALLFQQDLRAAKNIVEEGGKVHTQYYGLGFTGPIVSPLFYDAFFYFSSGQIRNGESHTILGFLTGGGLAYYMPNVLSSKIALDFVYASGDKDHETFYEGNIKGNSLAFIPISISSPALSFAPQLKNLFYPSLSFSFKPLAPIDHPVANNLSIQLKGIPFFRSTPGPISVTGVDPDSNALYLGTEFDFSINARPLNELGMGYSMGFFFPGKAMQDKTVQILGRFELSLSI